MFSGKLTNATIENGTLKGGNSLHGTYTDQNGNKYPAFNGTVNPDGSLSNQTISNF